MKNEYGTVKTATMTLKQIRQDVANGWKPMAIVSKDGFVSEISFTKTHSNGAQTISGFSFDCGCGLRQRELKSLLKRVIKVVPKLKIERQL